VLMRQRYGADVAILENLASALSCSSEDRDLVGRLWRICKVCAIKLSHSRGSLHGGLKTWDGLGARLESALE
jgi:hypothetical protein